MITLGRYYQNISQCYPCLLFLCDHPTESCNDHGQSFELAAVEITKKFFLLFFF